VRGKFLRVTDCFALFSLARRPVLDVGALKEKHLQLAARWHPDSPSGDGEKFRAVQEAYAVLLDPVLRLRHLLELEFGPAENKSLPPYQDLFLKVGASLQQARTVQQHLEKSQTALARALLAQDREAALQNVREATRSVEAARAISESELSALDARWPQVRAEELGDLASGLTFLTRWQSELSEAGFRLEHAGR